MNNPLFDKHDRDEHEADLELKRGTSVSLKAAVGSLNDRLDEGLYCPCCHQWAKRYKRPFNSGMAYGLIWLVKQGRRFADDDGYVAMGKCAPRRVVGNREYDKWVHWRVAEQAVNEDTSKRTSGLWRPTRLGRDFVYKRVSLARWVKLYNGTVQQFSDECISIEDALGEKFSYEKLMGEWS